jgi:transitional endoplasmic reticulum ATPase
MSAAVRALGTGLRTGSYLIAAVGVMSFPVCVLISLFSNNFMDQSSVAYPTMLWGFLPALLWLSALALLPWLWTHEAPASSALLSLAAGALWVPLIGEGAYPEFLAFSSLAASLACSLWLFRWIAQKQGLTVDSRPSPLRHIGAALFARHHEETELTGDQSVSAPTYPAVRARYSFAEVVGMMALKLRLREAASEIVASASNRQQARNGILFSGAPGNGKTFMAEALAGEMKLPIIQVSFGDFASKWVNQTSEQMRAVFQDARRQAPCVLFLDEIDSLLVDRGAVAHSGGEPARMTNILLTELVSIRSAAVVVIAATNHPDKLDGAGSREGRFDFKIEITPPDMPARRALIAQQVRSFKTLTVEDSALAQAAKRWDGFSVARIRTVVDEAGRGAVKAAQTCITYPDLQCALRTIQGHRGDLPAETPALSDLTLAPALQASLTGIAKRMRNIELIEAQGGTVPSGLMFYGPPGTGKTLSARALAKTSEWAFLATTGSDLLRDSTAIETLTRKARDLRPCIIFIDEADDVCANRQYSAPAVVSITNALLSAMDGANGQCADVLWIAATNYPENMDPAIQRRLGEKIEFALPDEHTLAQFIRQWIAEKPAVRFEAQVTPTGVARFLAGLSIAHVKEVLQQAVNHAIALNMQTVVGGAITPQPQPFAQSQHLPQSQVPSSPQSRHAPAHLTLVRATDLQTARNTVRALDDAER